MGLASIFAALPAPFHPPRSRLKWESWGTYTKSTEWAYEGEYRLAIPDYVPVGAERFMEFYPNELCRVLFGCRVPDERRREIEELARTLNPNVRFSRAVMARREYALEWVDD